MLKRLESAQRRHMQALRQLVQIRGLVQSQVVMARLGLLSDTANRRDKDDSLLVADATPARLESHPEPTNFEMQMQSNAERRLR